MRNRLKASQRRARGDLGLKTFTYCTSLKHAIFSYKTFSFPPELWQGQEHRQAFLDEYKYKLTLPYIPQTYTAKMYIL